MAGAAAQLAGVFWVLQWSHALVAHGPTGYNEARLWHGMTWLDSAKLLALAYLLLAPGVRYLTRSSRDEGDRFAAGLGIVVVGALCLCAVTTLLEFGITTWGSYDGAFDPADGVSRFGGIARSLTSSVVLTVALVALSVRAARRHVAPYWPVPVLAVGCLPTYFIGGADPACVRAGVAHLRRVAPDAARRRAALPGLGDPEPLPEPPLRASQPGLGVWHRVRRTGGLA